MNNSGSVDSSEIKEENNYYPFGLKMKGFNNVVTGRDHKYGFGDKEEQDELGLEWMDFHARNYDASLGRWMNIDPLAEKFYDFTPYNYANNNPIYFIDPDGMESKDWVYKDGGYYWDENINAADEVPENSGIEYVGENRSDVDEHYDNRSSWDAIKTGGKNVDEQSYYNYVNKTINKNLNRAINSANTQNPVYIFEGIRGLNHDQKMYSTNSASNTAKNFKGFQLEFDGYEATVGRGVLLTTGKRTTFREMPTIHMVKFKEQTYNGRPSNVKLPLMIKLYGPQRRDVDAIGTIYLSRDYLDYFDNVRKNGSH
jgi:RHS repeat-associated protein